MANTGLLIPMENRSANILPRALIAGLIIIGLCAPGEAATKRRPSSATNSGGVALSTPDPQTPLEHNNRAVELGSKGLWKEAIREHEIALEADPNNKEFRTNLSAAQLRYGDLLSAKKDYYNAIKQYRGALYVDPNNNPADQNLDHVLQLTGKDPDNIKVRMGMAEDADVAGDYETAIVEYRKCVKMSEDGPSHARLGRVLLKAGKVVDGYAELKIAVGKTWEKQDKNDLGAAHRQLGDVLKQYAFIAKNDGRATIGMKRLLNAGIEYRRAVTINPADSDAIRSLIEVAREAVAINPSFDNQLTLAAAYQLAGDFEHAKMSYEECWKLSPNNIALRKARRSFYRAVVTNAMTPPDMLADTVQKIQAALGKEPNDPELLFLMGRGKEAQGDKAAALDFYNKAAAINAYIDPDLKNRISILNGGPGEVAGQADAKKGVPTKVNVKETVDTRAQAQYSAIEDKIGKNDLAGAEKDLTDLVSKDPKQAHAWLLLGNVHEKKGDLDQAVVEYRQADNLKDPAAGLALRTIDSSRINSVMKDAEDAMSKQDWVKASQCLREAISMASELPLPHRKMSEVLRQLGDTKEADRELKKATELEK